MTLPRRFREGGVIIMKTRLALVAVFLLGSMYPAVANAANPYTILMDQRMKQAQHDLDLAQKEKGSEREKMVHQNLELMKRNLRLMSGNMTKMNQQMEKMIQKYRSDHHRQMAKMMQAMIEEHRYVLTVLKQMVEGAELRNPSLNKGSGK
jgi:lauroyl/myristoyl acyltransferase